MRQLSSDAGTQSGYSQRNELMRQIDVPRIRDRFKQLSTAFLADSWNGHQIISFQPKEIDGFTDRTVTHERCDRRLPQSSNPQAAS